MPNKQLKRGTSAWPSKFKRRNSSMCDQSCSHLLRNATTTRQIRPAPQRFGQRSTRLHLVLSVCIRQDSGGANKHEVRAGPVLFYDSSAMMLRIRNAATFALASRLKNWRRTPLSALDCAEKWKVSSMRKEKLKANFKKDRSIPNRNTTRSENVSRKQNKQMAHHGPVRRAASKARGF